MEYKGYSAGQKYHIFSNVDSRIENVLMQSLNNEIKENKVMQNEMAI